MSKIIRLKIFNKLCIFNNFVLNLFMGVKNFHINHIYANEIYTLVNSNYFLMLCIITNLRGIVYNSTKC